VPPEPPPESDRTIFTPPPGGVAPPGPALETVGNSIVRFDGSSRSVRGFTPTFMAPVRKGDGTEPENLFREDGEPREQADVFLAIVKRCTVGDGKIKPDLSWD